MPTRSLSAIARVSVLLIIAASCSLIEPAGRSEPITVTDANTAVPQPAADVGALVVEVPPNTEPTIAAPTTAAPEPEPPAGETPPNTESATAAPTTTTAPEPEPRPLGVVLVPMFDVLNIRAEPGADNPILATLQPTQTKLIPTGRRAAVSGSTWHQISAGDVLGWVHGRYVTETWDTAEVRQRWDWETALERFVDALATGHGLDEAVTWRGFYAVDSSGVFHWWRPSEVAGLVAQNPPMAWNYLGASAEEFGPTPFNELITDIIIETYRDPDVQFEVRGMTLGGGAVPPEYAVSSAFENFIWVAMHDPGNNPDFAGMDWITWFVYLELDGTIPKVVGVQPQMWGP